MARTRSSSNRLLPSSFLLQTFPVLANLPFNDSDWFRKDDDVRWQWSEATWTGSPEGEHNLAHQFGVPPRDNANFAWVQHFIHHLAPAAPGSSGGMAGFILANGSLPSDIGEKPTEAYRKIQGSNVPVLYDRV